MAALTVVLFDDFQTSIFIRQDQELSAKLLCSFSGKERTNTAIMQLLLIAFI